MPPRDDGADKSALRRTISEAGRVLLGDSGDSHRLGTKVGAHTRGACVALGHSERDGCGLTWSALDRKPDIW